MPTTTAVNTVVNTVVIGAGHAGLAMSRCLTERGVEHLVLERGRTAERWRTARWDSFRLLTPNWMSRLPGWAYTGPEPDGYMAAAELVAYLEGYARSFAAPILEKTTVLQVRQAAGGYLVRTDRGAWTAANVVATGYHVRAAVPGFARDLPADLVQITPDRYRRPADLPGGAVLVVGASSSGVQIADELLRAGRPVVLAVGGHTRLPRRYRGRDILWWLDRVGTLDRTLDELPDPVRARREPSLQLSGTGRTLDLHTLHEQGALLTGRMLGCEGGHAYFADDLAAVTAAADARLRRVLARIDAYAAGAPEPHPIAAALPDPGPLQLGLRRFAAVVWATGLRPAYPWLEVPVLDAGGRILHRRGVTAAPGLYALGLRFQHRRNSTFIDGARHDAAYLADHLTRRRPARSRAASRRTEACPCPRNTTMSS
ncbi:NAD(P)-binding domain-containing protein [Microbispora sp. NPDC046933]|uniref:NAD(P)-binding domain-containing protein n=1 Tax=Microbispora sp. NPDC046933 TaxID=3155618 RepID=UPI0033EB7F34